MNYTVYIRSSNSLRSGELGSIGDIFRTIGGITLGATPAIVPLIPGLPQSVQNAISAGSQILSGFLGSLSNSGQARGLAAINAFGQQVLAQFQQLAQAAQQGMPREQVYQVADQLVAVLSNSQYVYQAQRGNDAEALRNFKTQAAQLAAEVKQIADSVAGQTTPLAQTTPPTQTTGQTSTTPANVPVTPANQQVSNASFLSFLPSLDGSMTSYLILGGGILLVVWWLKS